MSRFKLTSSKTVGTLETRETNDFVHPKRDYSITAALPGSEAEPIPGCDSDSTPGCPEPLDTSPLFVRANHEYHPTDPSALSFNQNDVIEVLDQKESGWWDGLLGGERGWFPSNFVDVVLDMTEAASYGAEYAAAAASPPMPGKSVGATELDAKAKTTPPPSPGRQVSPKVAQGEPAAQDSAGSWWDGPVCTLSVIIRQRGAYLAVLRDVLCEPAGSRKCQSCAQAGAD